MIKLNNKDYEWSEGLTVTELMKQNNFTYQRIVVSINEKVILPEDYDSTFISDGDDCKMIHLLAGG